MPAAHFLQVGGITIALRADDRIRWQWSGASQRFLVDAQEADVELDAVVLDSPLPPAGPLLFDSGAVWRMFRDGDGYRVECLSDSLGAEPYKVARFDAAFRRGTIFLQPHAAALGLNPLDYPLDEVLIANLLGRGRGVELHSCGIVDRSGGGRLFVGVSGAGKSTTARLWAGQSAGVVSDDRVIVREDGGAFSMYGTPWHGEEALSEARHAPLEGVYLLVQSPSNELREIPRAAAVAQLFRCSFPPFYDGAAVDFTLGVLERIVDSVPVRELHFTRDRGAVDLVLGAGA